MKKFFIFLLVLVVVIGAVYFLKQKNSSTPTNPSIELDDRTYTDPKYNFSFSYPENLEINLLEDQIILSKKSFNKSESRVLKNLFWICRVLPAEKKLLKSSAPV